MSIEQFEFDGKSFPIVETDQLPSGYGVPIATVCKHLGVDIQGQQQNIERRPWSQTRTCVTHVQLPGDTQRRSVFLLDTGRFAMWMATIDASRIKNPDAKARIERWQDEAADALDNYLRRGVAVSPDTERFSDEYIQAEVQRQLEMRRYEVIIRDIINGFEDPSQDMYKDIRNKFLRKVSGMTARQLVASGREIRTWTGKTGPTRRDRTVGTNYLTEHELLEFNLLLDYAALEMRRAQPKNYPELVEVCRRAAEKASY